MASSIPHKMNIIFFGSTSFSVPIVKQIKEKFPLLAVVVTKPKPRGRGRKTTLPEIAEWAQRVGVTVLSPENPNEEAFIKDVSSLDPDLFVLSAYGHILSGELLAVPRLGGINVHPSLLPHYRGAAPIQRALMTGEEETGITIFFMDEKIDHGDIIFQKKLVIDSHDTYGSLSARLSSLAAACIVDVVRSIEAGHYTKIQQKDEEKSIAPKVKKEEMVINWHAGIDKIFNHIRALSPQPGARTAFRAKELKIIRVARGQKRLEPGILHIEDRKVYVGTGDGALIIHELQPENRSKISGRDFINGFRVKEGERVG